MKKPYKTERNEVQVLWFLHETLSRTILAISFFCFISPSISHSQHISLLLASHVWIRVWRPWSPYLQNIAIWFQVDFQCSRTPAGFWQPGKDSQLTGCLVLCKSQMPLKLSIKSWLTHCLAWRKLLSLLICIIFTTKIAAVLNKWGSFVANNLIKKCKFSSEHKDGKFTRIKGVLLFPDFCPVVHNCKDASEA